MVPIFLGTILGAVGGGLLGTHLASKDRKNFGTSWNGGYTTFWAVMFVIYVIAFGAVLGLVGYGINFLYPAPPRPVEERVVVETLLPFSKETETDPTIYGILFTYDNTVRVRYNDGTAVKVGLCCNGTAPRIVEAGHDNHPSIKRYHRPGYRGWLSLRFDNTWYEIHVLRRGSIIPDQLIPAEILR